MKTTITYTVFLFLITNSIIYAQWDCGSMFIFDAKYSGSDVVCAGSSTQMGFRLNLGGAVFINVRVELWNVDKNMSTGINKEEKNICVFPRCSSAVDIAKRNQTWSFEIPENLEPGNYSFKTTVYQEATIKTTDPTCNTRAFKIIKPELKLYYQSSFFGTGASIYDPDKSCKTNTIRWSDGSTDLIRTVICTNVTTTYTVSCETNCGTVITSNPVTIPAVPKYPDIQGAPSFCTGSSTILTSSFSDASLIQWYKDGMAIDKGIKNITTSESGIYQVGSTSSCREQSKSNPFVVQKSQPVVGNIKGGFEFCAGSSLTLTTEASGGIGVYQYEWLRNGEKVGDGSSFTVNTSGNYRTRVTDAIGCKATFPTDVPILENPRPVFTLPPLSNLTGTETQGLQAIPVSYSTGPYTYNWSTEPRVNISVTNDRYDFPFFGPFTQNTTIKLRVTDAKGCQSEEISTLLTYIPCTLNAGIQSQSFFFCKGSLPLAATVQNGNDAYTYQWLKDNNPIGGGTSTLDATEGGQYSVVIIDKKGCRSTSSTVNVIKGNPSVQITGNLEFCVGGSTLLKTTTQNAKTPLIYKWSGASSTDSLRVGAAGSYTVEITDAQGCSATSPAVTVTQNALPTANAGIGKNVTCAETYALTGVSTATGGAGGYQYAWSSSPAVVIQGSTTAQPTLGPFVENTTVQVRVTDSKGCVGTARSTVTYIPPDLSVTLTGASEFCSGKSVPLKTTVEKANLPLKQLVWYNGTQEVKRDLNEWNTNQKGNYTVFVEDSKGCRKTSNILGIAENPTPTVVITGSSFYCYSSNTTLSAKVSSGTPPFKHQWQLNGTSTGTDSPALTAATAGNYGLLLTDAKGCSAEASAFGVVEKGEELIAQITPQGPLSVYAPEKVLLIATLGKEYQYQWKRDNANIVGANGVAYTAEQSGNYSVVVSRGECSRSSAAVVVKVEVPTAVSNSAIKEWMFWPNPVNDKLQIKSPQTAPAKIDIAVYDALGRPMTEIKNTNTQPQTTLDMGNFPAGQYFIKISTSTYHFSTPIIKQ